MRQLKRFFLSCLCALCAFATPAAAAGPGPRQLIMVLDASGSMLEKVEGKAKMAAAREVLGTVIESLPDTSEAGLIAYGHRKKDKCDDIELLLPIGPLDKAAFMAKVGKLSPKGKTPLTAATQQAIDLAKKSGKPATIVLVSDGLETCGASPCDMVKQAKAAGIDFVLHVVGFDLKKEDSSALRCAAQAGGGQYLEAANADQLSAALEQTVATVRVPTGKLTVTASANGQPIDATATLSDSASHEYVQSKFWLREKTIVPRAFRVPAGKYDLKVTPRSRSIAPMEVKAIEVTAGQELTQAIAFGTGKLSLTVTNNGAPLSAKPVLRIHRSGERKLVASSSARASAYDAAKGSFEIELNGGAYEIEISTPEIGGVPKRTVQATVEPGKTAAASYDFESGKVVFTVRKDGKPCVSTILVNGADPGVRHGLTTATNPTAEFVLVPGDYEVTVSAHDAGKKRFDLTLKKGETVERVLDL